MTIAFLWMGPGLATSARAEPVDVELVIATDVSHSMNFGEKFLQFSGFSAAFRNPQVVDAITSGRLGRIAVTVMEWGGEGMQNVVIPWTMVDSRASAAALADAIDAHHPGVLPRGTAIGDALARAAALLAGSPHRGMRRVIDVSGDGINNRGLPLAEVRARVVAEGITINGLPIALSASPEAAEADPRGADLVAYFTHAVIGGPTAFVQPATTIERFAEAIRIKLLREICGCDEIAALETGQRFLLAAAMASPPGALHPTQ